VTCDVRELELTPTSDGLAAVLHLEFAEDGRHEGLHGVGGDRELRRDLAHSHVVVNPVQSTTTTSADSSPSSTPPPD
jgi:hypothetical protein